MKFAKWTSITAVALFTVLALPLQLPAQDKAKPDHHHKYHHYQLNDVGTFGGPSSYLFAPGSPRAGVQLDQRKRTDCGNR